jgi:hypothetical protein
MAIKAFELDFYSRFYERYCLWCNEFYTTHSEKSRYCSTLCYKRAWRVKKGRVVPRIERCLECNKKISKRTRAGTRFCGRKHRDKAWRKRKRDNEQSTKQNGQ